MKQAVLLLPSPDSGRRGDKKKGWDLGPGFRVKKKPLWGCARSISTISPRAVKPTAVQGLV